MSDQRFYSEFDSEGWRVVDRKTGRRSPRSTPHRSVADLAAALLNSGAPWEAQRVLDPAKGELLMRGLLARLRPQKNTDERFIVWSNEHRAFWREGFVGYTSDVRQAGVYSRDQAVGIAENAAPGSYLDHLDGTFVPNETLLPVAVAAQAVAEIRRRRGEDDDTTTEA